MSSSHCKQIGVDSEFVLTVDLLYRENSTTISALNPMLKTGRHRCVTTSHALIAAGPAVSVPTNSCKGRIILNLLKRRRRATTCVRKRTDINCRAPKCISNRMTK